MESTVNAADVMVQRVIVVDPDSTIRDVAALLVSKHISAVPVTDADGKLLGIISEGDLLRRSENDTERRRSWWLRWLVSAETLTAEFIKSHSRKVSDVMTRNVIVAKPDTPLHEIATLLERHKIKRVPIVENEKIVGIVRRANLVQTLATRCDDYPPAVPDDTALREAVMTALEKQAWAPTTLVNVTARAGVIDIWGIVDSEMQREAIRVAVEVTPGVTMVNDNLIVRPIVPMTYV
jgi:CBS-domain-containing membrane protein